MHEDCAGLKYSSPKFVTCDSEIIFRHQSLPSLKMLNTSRSRPILAVPIWRPWPVYQTTGLQVSTVFTHGERTESLRARVGIPPSQAVPGLLAPGGQLQDSAKPPWSTISLSLPFLWRNNPALRQKVQGKQDNVLGAIRRHCCQTRPGAAHELTAANAI